jgi:hypothetical protein
MKMLQRRNGEFSVLSLIFLLCFLTLTAISGCTTPQPREFPAFRQGIVTANQQTNAAFLDINEMLREQQLDRAAQQATLNEDAFAEGLPADSRAKWMRAFRLMEEYAWGLEELTSSEQREGVEDELRKLGEKFNDTREEPLPEGVTGGFVKLGGLLIKIKAEQDALEIMREVNPAIQDIFATMADAIGSDEKEGIRLTVWSAWTTQLGKLQLAFLKADNPSSKRKIAEKFLNMLGERDAHDQLLNSLRISFLSLGRAHQEMAQGNPLTASAFIAIVQDEYRGFREEMKRLREKREGS